MKLDGRFLFKFIIRFVILVIVSGFVMGLTANFINSLILRVMNSNGRGIIVSSTVVYTLFSSLTLYIATYLSADSVFSVEATYDETSLKRIHNFLLCFFLVIIVINIVTQIYQYNVNVDKVLSTFRTNSMFHSKEDVDLILHGARINYGWRNLFQGTVTSVVLIAMILLSRKIVSGKHNTVEASN